MFPFPPGTEIKAFVLYLPRALSVMPYMPEKMEAPMRHFMTANILTRITVDMIRIAIRRLPLC